MAPKNKNKKEDGGGNAIILVDFNRHLGVSMKLVGIKAI